MLENLHEIFAHLRAVVVAITGRIEGDFACCLTNGVRRDGFDHWGHSLLECFSMHAGQRSFVMNRQCLVDDFSETGVTVERVNGDID